VRVRRLVRALDLVNDARIIADYRSRHAPGAVWPEVVAYIRATGVLDMEIWCVENRLFMILEVTDDYPRDIAEPDRVADWERLMSAFQQPLPGAPRDQKWLPLSRIFSLSGSDQQS
jgi:L-rhamnose mutarotase